MLLVFLIISFQNVFYTMFTTTIGFYLPAALVSAIYTKLFMVFRGRVRARLDREVQGGKSVGTFWPDSWLFP